MKIDKKKIEKLMKIWRINENLKTCWYLGTDLILKKWISVLIFTSFFRYCRVLGRFFHNICSGTVQCHMYSDCLTNMLCIKIFCMSCLQKKSWLLNKPVVSLDVLKEFQTWNELLICVFGVFCTSLFKALEIIR